MGNTNPKKSALYSQVQQIGALTAIPILLVVAPLLGYFSGDWIDRKFRVYPWFTILLVFLGFAAAGREIFRLVKQILKEDKENGLK